MQSTPAEPNYRNIEITQDGTNPLPYQDRSITINHSGERITWIPRGQLVPPAHHKAPTPKPSNTSLNLTTPKKKLASEPRTAPKPETKSYRKTIMHRLKRVLLISSRKTTKATKTGIHDTSSLPEEKKEGWLSLKEFLGMGRRKSKGRGKGKEEYVRVPRRDFEALSRFAVGEARARKNGNRIGSFSYVCTGCGESGLSVVRDKRNFCEACREMVEGDGNKLMMSGGIVERERRDSDEWVEDLKPLQGPTTVRHNDLVRRATEMISGSSILGAEPSHSSLYPYSSTSSGLSSEKTQKSSGRWRFKKGCRDRKCGTIAEDEEGPYINTCSEDSWVFVNNEDEAIIQLTAAPRSSPRHSKSASSSPEIETLREETAKNALEELEGLPPKHPLIFVGRSAYLERALAEAVNTPLPSRKEPYTTPPNTPEPLLVSAPVTVRNLAIHASALARNDNEREVLNIPVPTSTERYSNKSFKELWDLLECSDGIAASSPASLCVDKPRNSIDERFDFPDSLNNSEICAAVIRTWMTRQAQTPSARPPLPTGSPNSLMRYGRDFEEPNSTPSPPPEMSRGHYFEGPTPFPNPLWGSPDSLMRGLGSSYFDRIKQLDRTPSPSVAPPSSFTTSGMMAAPHLPSTSNHILGPELPPNGYPALDSSATALDYGFHPTLRMEPAPLPHTPPPPQICSSAEPPDWSELRKNRNRLFGAGSSSPTPPSPPPRVSEEWNNNCRSLFGTDPEPHIRTVRIPEVLVRGGGQAVGDVERGKKLLDEKIDITDYYLAGMRKGNAQNWRDLCGKIERRVEERKETKRMEKEKKLSEAKVNEGVGEVLKGLMSTATEVLQNGEGKGKRKEDGSAADGAGAA